MTDRDRIRSALSPITSRVALCGAMSLLLATSLVMAGAATPTDSSLVKRSAPARTQDDKSEGALNTPAENEITPEMRIAVERGLEYLKSQQNSDGSFGRGRYGKNVGIAALAALAFMADGSLPGRGPYGDQVERALHQASRHWTNDYGIRGG